MGNGLARELQEVKPAPPVDCAAQFGNSDAYVARITP